LNKELSKVQYLLQESARLKECLQAHAAFDQGLCPTTPVKSGAATDQTDDGNEAKWKLN